MENKITVGIITALLASNMIVGYQFAKSHNEQVALIEKQQDKIKVLTEVNGSQISKLNTYSNEIDGLRGTVKERNTEIAELNNRLEEMKERIKKSP